MVLRIIGKGNKERLVPQPVLADLERLWRRHHNRTWSRGTLRPLDPNNKGTGPVSPTVLFRTFNAAATAAGFTTRRPTPHVLRHSYATRLLENGVDTRVVQVSASVTRASPRRRSTPTSPAPTRASLRGCALRSPLDNIMTGL